MGRTPGPFLKGGPFQGSPGGLLVVFPLAGKSNAYPYMFFGTMFALASNKSGPVVRFVSKTGILVSLFS